MLGPTMLASLLLVWASLCNADHPSPAEDSYGSPSKPAVKAPDSYGSPSSAGVSPAPDTYGSPVGAPVSYSPAPASGASPAAPGNQGFYYYYYPVRQNVPENQHSEDKGVLDGLLGGLLTTKVEVLLLILGIAGFILLITLGINLSNGSGRSFTARAMDMAAPYMTTGNLIALLDSVNNAIDKYEH